MKAISQILFLLSMAISSVGFAQSPIAVCCGDNCCRIVGVRANSCFARGEAHPTEPCLVCAPESSQSAFSVAAACMDAGSAPTDAGPPPATDGGGIVPPIDAGSTDAGGPAP
ncbi:MAG: hypothetical protein K8H88_27545, partial [Sandaracinaceae bacterium]|nr:hypothetical protein [Sandaracinaceae bacterium]